MISDWPPSGLGEGEANLMSVAEGSISTGRTVILCFGGVGASVPEWRWYFVGTAGPVYTGTCTNGDGDGLE